MMLVAPRSSPPRCDVKSEASNIGTEHFVGQAGAAAEGGVSVAIYEWSAGLGVDMQGGV